MRKTMTIIALLVIATLASCGGGSSSEATDSTAVQVDTVQVVADSVSVK